MPGARGVPDAAPACQLSSQGLMHLYLCQGAHWRWQGPAATIAANGLSPTLASDPMKLTDAHPPHALGHTLLAVHQAGRTVPFAQFQRRALELLCELIPFDSAWWGNASVDPGQILQLHLFNCDEAILSAYQPYIEEDFMRAALMARPGTTVNLADLTTREALVRSPLYRNVGRRFHIEWSLGTVLVEPVSGLQEFLTIWRHDAGRPFTEAERQLKELVMPHLAEAHRAARMHELLGHIGTRNDRWAVVDAHGFLREVCAGFVHAMRQQWPQWNAARIPPALQQALARAPTVQNQHWKLTVTARGNFRFLQVLSLGATDRLTAREREIATHFAHGSSHGAIAAALQLSPATVRNHIARCYRKLGVNNKAELALRMSAGQTQAV
jgi:DNA-binding CsgD family transcriptional regulator